MTSSGLAGVNDENVIQVLFVHKPGEVDDSFYLVTEWLETDLESILATEDLEPSAGLEIVRKVTTGLRALHLAGIVHHDVKPRSIFLSGDGRKVKIGDVGLATSVGADATLAFNPEYGAPEVYDREAVVSARTDVYSLGFVAYRLLLGRARLGDAFPDVYGSGADGNIGTRWLNWHLDRNRPAPALHELMPDRISEKVSAVMQKMVSKSPAERFADASEALNALQAALDDAAPRPAATEAVAEPIKPMPIPEPAQKRGGLMSRLNASPKIMAAAAAAIVVWVVIIGLVYVTACAGRATSTSR